MTRPKYKTKYLKQRKITKHFLIVLLLSLLAITCLLYERSNATLISPLSDTPTPVIRTVSKVRRWEGIASYSPSDNTVAVMNANVGVNAKIHAHFGDYWMAWAELIAMESSFNPSAINPTSGACGLPQASPCSKMDCPLDYEGVECQLDWIENYVLERYGSIEKALYHHDIVNWY